MMSTRMDHDHHYTTGLLLRQPLRFGRVLTRIFRSCGSILSVLAIAAGANAQSTDPLAAAQEGFDHPVKFAIYSTAWHLSTNAGLRVVAQNQSNEAIELRSVVFRNETGDGNDTELQLNMQVAPGKWAELQLPYQDLLSGHECVVRTMQDDWKLVEISNYTLNPSVRGLIIENTRSFRIYQCVRAVRTTWVYAGSSHEGGNEEKVDNQWLMYHFERLPLD
ncbi:MAG: hypothetical protein Q7W55_14690 [Pseudohongiella sp.]|nr:hypothetical protein [Pseudohongiella sp.]MDO9520830.1 hypothetical protein [Pseudohongiella sp.]MDP2128107.1 hypothetical protein [Pseudohongiella sp.]